MHVEEELKTYLQVLWRYKWMIVACAIITSLVVLGISFQLTPIYSGTAILRVASAPGGSSDYTYISSLNRLTNTLVEIANSDATLWELAEQFGLEKQPKVEVEVVPETELIRIEASDPDPARARDIANTLADMIVEQNVQFYGGDTPSARELLEGQLEQAKIDLDSAVSGYDSALRCSDSATAMPVIGSPGNCPNAETLARILGIRQQIYTDLLQKYEAARTSEQLRANNITIVEHASIAQKPTIPKVPLYTALGLVAGLAMGVILAFFFESIDDTLRGVEDVQAMTALPIMCQIPQRKRTLTSVVDSPFSRNGHLLSMPAFHQLGARLLLSEAWPKSTSLLITSPEPGAGKSTVAANLSLSLAEAGHRVVLLDMDFHRPRLHSIFSLPNELGLSDYMCGKIHLNAALQQDALSPNLRIATAGSCLGGTSEWLTPDKIKELLGQLEHDADYVLIDAPAFLSVADPALIASQVAAVILVVARRVTGRKQFRLTLQQLTELNAKLAGIVVNKVSHSRVYSYYEERSPKKGKPIEKAKPVESEEAQHTGES